MAKAFRPIQLRDANHQVMPFSYANVQTRQSVAGTSNITYIGYARSNILANEAGWMIIKQSFDASGNIVHITHAVDGNDEQSKFNQIWDISSELTITAITKAAAAEVTTSVDHGLETGDFVEISGSNMTEVNSDGFGLNIYSIKKIDATKFTLVSPSTGLDVNSTGFTNVGNSGSVYNRTYTTLNYK